MHGYRCALIATSEKGDHEKVRKFCLENATSPDDHS
jgi:hypothetical protein